MNTGTRSKGISKLIILAIVLFVPGFLYLLMEKLGTHEYVKLPVYGEKVLTGEMRRVMGREIPDTAYHQLPAIEFVNAEGNPTKFLGSDTTITVAHLFYSTDSLLSATMLDIMNKLAIKFKSKPSVKIFSISVDQRDSPSILQSFAKKYDDLNPQWQLVTQPSVDILQYAREQMLIDAMRDPADTSKYIISDQIILIDSQRRIRGFYPVEHYTEIKRLEDEIKVQLVEEVRNNPLTVKKK